MGTFGPPRARNPVSVRVRLSRLVLRPADDRTHGSPTALGTRFFHPTLVGRVVVVRMAAAGDVFAVGFDPDALAVRGEPVALPYQVPSFTALPSLAVSASGTMVFGGGDGPEQFDRFRLLWVDGSGRTTQVDTYCTRVGEGVPVSPESPPCRCRHFRRSP